MAISGPEEGTHAARQKRERVFFWFVCSALTGVSASGYAPEHVAERTLKIAEAMTERWMADYEDADIPVR